MSKSTIRDQLRLRRSGLSEAHRHQANLQIVEHIRNSEFWQQAKAVAIYLAFGDEADISALLESTQAIYLPSIKGKDMQFQLFTEGTQFETLGYGLKQPCFIDDLPQDSLDLYLMPLVGFDLNGTRLGMGGGYYDRYFATHHKGIRAGVAYQCQQVEQLPSDPWDVKIQHIFTEQGHYEF